MKKKKRFYIVLPPFLFLVYLIFLVSGCGLLTPDKMAMEMIQEKGELRVGIAPNYPPLIFKQGQEIKGLEADMAAAVGQHFNVPVVYVEKQFNQLIRALNEGEIDIIMSGMSITKQRGLVVQFTEPYTHVGQIALVRKQDKNRFYPPKKAIYENALRVGYESGTTGMTFAVNTLLMAELVKFDSADDGLAALRSGEIAAFIHDSPTAWRITSDPSSNLVILTDPLTDEPLAWAIRKDDPALLRELNALMKDWKKSGKMQQILDRWIPVPSK
jgi:polar amino acid transport system substrate-binding protein